MAGEQQGGKRPLERAPESLGWLTQSSVQPKRHKHIEGVGAGSLVEFKAQLYRKQQEAEGVREGRLDPEELRQRRKGLVGALVDRKNAGVEGRDTKDKLAIKTSSDRLTDSRVALERKAELYDRLARGEVEDDEDRYEVNFLMKGRGGEGASGRGDTRMPGSSAVPWHELDSADLAVHTRTGGPVSADMAQERDRRAWEEEVSANMRAEQQQERQRQERRALVAEVEEETKAGREQAMAAKEQRAEADARKQERLKAAFLKKQLEALKQQKAGALRQSKQQQQQAGGAG